MTSPAGETSFPSFLAALEELVETQKNISDSLTSISGKLTVIHEDLADIAQVGQRMLPS